MAKNQFKGGGKVISLKVEPIKIKIVASATCEVCKDKCQSGIKYLEKMSQPGAEGKGVPCSKQK